MSLPIRPVLAGLLFFCIFGLHSAIGSITLYYDSFETYPVQNPAPNPLTNGPAGGQWFYVDPNSTLTANEHRIFDASASGGSGLNSRCWITFTNDARLTNAIAISALPAGSGPYTFRLSFVAAPETGTVTNATTLKYRVASTGGSLSFVSGGNQNGSTVFSSLEGYATNYGGLTGKSPDRRYDIVFTGTGLTTSDKIILDFTRLANNFGAAAYLALDDVLLTLDDGNGPIVSTVTPILTMQHVQLAFGEPVDPESATNLTNYSFSGGLTPLSVALIDPMVVEVRTTPQAPGTQYTLTASGVKGRTGVAMTSTQKTFTAPGIVISSVRYDAGTTLTKPAGPASPDSDAGGLWATAGNTNVGMSVAAVKDDAGTGFNAWQITDNNPTAATGGIDYRMAIDPLSDRWARTNGWRLTARLRYVDALYSSAVDQVVLYGDPQSGINLRYGIFLGLNADGNLIAQVLGGATYVLTSDSASALSYHDHVLVFDPRTMRASYYFDGQLVASNYAGQSPPGYDGVVFGSASATSTGQVNYNLVQLDVVGGSKPVLISGPQSTTNGVGQRVTFKAEFTPFVASYQWFTNNVLVVGTNGNTYTTPLLTTAYDGLQVKAVALHALGNVETPAARLTVTSDTNPPVVASTRGSLLYNTVTITYSEPVLEAYATNINNYVWTTSGITNLSARMLDPFTVQLLTTPQASASTVSLKISNVRDTSNLIIAANTPVSFYNLTLIPQIRYYAGTTADTPGGAPDPTSAAGGNWGLSLGSGSDPDITTTPVTDTATGLNSWQIRDASATTGKFANYTNALNADLHSAAAQGGWVLTMVSRMPELFTGTSGAHFLQYATPALWRWIGYYDQDDAGDLNVATWADNAFTTHPLTFGFGGDAWHTNQIVYDPVSKTASYWMDGAYVTTSPGGYSAGSTIGIFWGAASSAGKGTMDYHLIQFSTPNVPTTAVSLNGSNVEISYRGVLEATTGFPGAWTPVATNLTTTPAILSVPTSSGAQMMFRARTP